MLKQRDVWLSKEDGQLIISFNGEADAVCRVKDHAGSLLTVVIQDRTKALYMVEMDEEGLIVLIHWMTIW